MYIFAVSAFVLAGISLLLCAWKDGYKHPFGLAMGAFFLCGAIFGFWIHGGVTDYQTQNSYLAGEANGYNRGFEAGKAIVSVNNEALRAAGYLSNSNDEYFERQMIERLIEGIASGNATIEFDNTTGYAKGVISIYYERR
jgi:hypothetical protein